MIYGAFGYIAYQAINQVWDLTCIYFSKLLDGAIHIKNVHGMVVEFIPTYTINVLLVQCIYLLEKDSANMWLDLFAKPHS